MASDFRGVKCHQYDENGEGQWWIDNPVLSFSAIQDWLPRVVSFILPFNKFFCLSFSSYRCCFNLKLGTFLGGNKNANLVVYIQENKFCLRMQLIVLVNPNPFNEVHIQHTMLLCPMFAARLPGFCSDLLGIDSFRVILD